MSSDRLTSVSRLILVAAAATCVWGAVVAPAGIELAIVPWDKASHFIAFYGLTLLMFSAFPDRRRFDLTLIAVLMGAGVELAQQVVGRDAELSDIAADAAGAFAVMAPLWLERLRSAPRRERRRRRAERFPEGARPEPQTV